MSINAKTESQCVTNFINSEMNGDHATQIGELAGWALATEVMLSPKPGLVDQLNTGSHSDLTVDLMLRSAQTLVPYFVEMAEAAQVPSHLACDLDLRESIGLIGRVAEKAMMSETKGVNTHRGAIWALGLLATSAAALGKNASAVQVCQQAGLIAQLPDQHAPVAFSKGLHATHRYRINGAREEAKNGFVSITECALPALKASRANGDSEQAAQLNALLALMTRLSDTCVLSRAGQTGLDLMQQGAQTILELGGAASELGMAELIELNKQMVALNASPGGAADLLAATIFVDALEQQSFETINDAKAHNLSLTTLGKYSIGGSL